MNCNNKIILLILFISFVSVSAKQFNFQIEGNPIFRDVFTADPAPMVIGDTLYVYVGHDEAHGDEMFTMTGWLCYSTKDMKNWTAHGEIMKPTDFSWAIRDAWAAQVVEKEGKYYLYATVQHDNIKPGKAIGVAVSDTPTGPFKDARGTALVSDETTPSDRAWNDIDPTVFIDDDGTGWIAWGNPYLYLAKLKPNMIEIDGEIQKIDLPNYTEGPWLYRRGDIYYMVYAAFAHQGTAEKICYATARDINGPWEYQGILTGFAEKSYTIHPGIVEFKGQSYLFYHNATLTLNGESGAVGRRCVCAEYLYYNSDGTIQPVTQTKPGIAISSKKSESILTEDKLAKNPIIWADVPDVSVIRVGDTYYMSSTTMYMNPGVPIMKSTDLVNWKMLGYAYDTLVDNDKMNLANGNNAYGAGSWASSLRFHHGKYYVSTFSSTSGKTHVYSTTDIEKCKWSAQEFSPSLHDHSLFFDDDGKVYMLYGAGDLKLVELKEDLSGIKPGGFNDVVIKNASAVAGLDIGLPAEGSQMIKVNGKYYVMNITWPRNGMRTQIIHRADKITGPYEGKIILQDQGVAQGCLIDTPEGKWYAMLFQDHGAVGRIPYLVPVKWEEGWPVLGEDGKVPITLDITDIEDGLANIVASDEFDWDGSIVMPLAWQWNHNPDSRFWSLSQRKGYLRLMTGRIDNEVVQARNTLTQRTFGPECTASTKIETANIKDGDYAGLLVLQKRYGFVGAKMENGNKYIVMTIAQNERPVETACIPLEQDSLYLKIECDYKNRTDKAYFFYSLDGIQWYQIGPVLQMAYTLPHFMGYRFGLFNYATQTYGGYVDFDYYHIADNISVH